MAPRETQRAGFPIFRQAHRAQHMAARIELRRARRPVGYGGDVTPGFHRGFRVDTWDCQVDDVRDAQREVSVDHRLEWSETLQQPFSK